MYFNLFPAMMADVNKRALYIATNIKELTDRAVLSIGEKVTAKQ